ncbi:MAG: class I SAM-dependent methyltransferase [Chthoniobacterales bacterium]
MNSYSHHWFEFFHAPIGHERTAREVEFICAVAPLPEFRRVLDVCCGMGRHARELAARRYSVTGVERDADAIVKARELGGGPDYVRADIREYQPATSAYDLAIVMSQSFGYFEHETNRELLGLLANGIRKGGRIILDLWNPEFFEAYQGERDLKMPSGVVRETRKVSDGRLFVHLTYPDGAEEDFEWQLFSAAEMRSLAESTGLVLVNDCTDFDPAMKRTPANPRIQFVLKVL